MKKLPVCKTCISGAYCFRCQQLIDNGYITEEFDISLARDLLEFEKKEFPKLKTASFYNAIDTGDYVFLVVGKGNIEKGLYPPELLEKICELYDIPKDGLFLIEKGTPKDMIQQIINPAKLIALNQIYLPTGEKEYKVVISKEDKERLRFPPEVIRKACILILREPVSLEFA